MCQKKLKKYNDRILTDIFLEAEIPENGDRQGQEENRQPSLYPHVQHIDIGFEFGHVGVGFEEVGFKMSRLVSKHSVGFEMLALSSRCPHWLVSRRCRWLVSRHRCWVRDVRVEFEMLALVLRCWHCDQDITVGFDTGIETSWLVDAGHSLVNSSGKGKEMRCGCTL